MSYIALARKWRPRTFSELLGQDHLVRALTQSLTQDRVHHAYLFTGTRGVGKTSVGRILAKALNCLEGASAEPCLVCENCQAIEQGRFIDLIEIDAASKTRVEDTRELLDNVQYAPTIGRYKIYLIDEVHMLSQHSFNALLKTLEEPPAHVKFLLATTDVQKLPITILSRCLQFHLKHVPEPIISGHLQTILRSENVVFEPQALVMIAKAARGSMRDALSLLDQCLSGQTGELNATNVSHLLGQTTEDFAVQLLQALCAHDPQQLVTISRNIAQAGGQFRYVLDELLAYLHRVAIVQTLSSTPEYIESQPEIALFSQQLAAEDTQLFYQIGLKGISDLPYAPTPSIGFEMILLRMYTFKPAAAADTPTLAYQQQPSQARVEPLSQALPEATAPFDKLDFNPLTVTVTPQTAHPERSEESGLEPPTSQALSETIPRFDELDFNPLTVTPQVHHPERSERSPEVDDVLNSEILRANRRDQDDVPWELPLTPMVEKIHAEPEDEPIAITTPLVGSSDWAAIIPQLQLNGLALSALQHSELLEKNPGQIILKIDKSHQSIFTPAVVTRIQDSLCTYYQEPTHVSLHYQNELVDSPAAQKKTADTQQQEAYTQALQNDPMFQQLQKEFSAALIQDSVSAS